MKIIVIVIVFSVTPLNAQNFLKSLYNLESFPKEMQKSKKFIEETCSDILIYDFIHSGSHYQFEIKSKKEVDFKLSLNEDIFISFFDTKTKKRVNNYTFHVDYDFKYALYYDEFILNDSTFSLSSIFNLAAKYYKLDEYRLVEKIINNYKPSIDYETKRIRFFEELSTALRLDRIPEFNQMITNEEKESLTNTEVEEIMLDAILDETEYEDITLQLFKYFILNKNDREKTKEKLVQIFENKNIIEEIETKVLQPKITIGLYEGDAYLNIPKKYVTTTNQSEMGMFPINHIEIGVDFKNNCLIIDFKNRESIDLTIGETLYSNKKEKNVSIKSKKIRYKISDSGIKFQIFKYNDYRQLDEKLPYEIKLN